MIHYVPHNQIDKERYDSCISYSSNSLIYAFSWYLDTVAPGWDLLEYDDYKVVMPLPNRKRFGISYIFTPRYIQQLGVFGKDVSTELIQTLLKKIPGKYKLLELKCNEKNTFEESSSWMKRTNYLLDISEDYETIRRSYHRNCSRNIRKAIDAGLSIGNTITAGEFAEFISNNLQDQIEGFIDRDVALLAAITQEIIDQNAGEIICVYDPEGNMSAAGSFLFSNERLIFSVCASSPVGHKQQAMYYLVDHQIRRYAGKYSLFDFSGSEFKGIAYFNSTFGAKTVSYPFVQINRLPFPLKLLTGKL
jgi:hypothetical protein